MPVSDLAWWLFVLFCSFVIFGIGLDDAFIVMGALGRTNHLKSPTDRVSDTFHDIGMSITLTTITSTLAFGLGCLSTIPFVFWLCLVSWVKFLFFFVFFVVVVGLKYSDSLPVFYSCYLRSMLFRP